MSKKLKFFAMMLTCILLNVNHVWGTTWNYTFNSNPISDGSMTINSATWSVATASSTGSPTITYATYSKIGGVKFGSSSKHYWGKITLSTSYFTSGNISSVTVNALLNAGVSTTMTIKQGSTTIGSPTYSTATTWHDFIANTNTGSGGTLSIEITSSNAIYIHSISVTYTAGGSTKTLVYNANGADGGTVPTDATAYNVGDEATVKGNTGGLYKIGHTFAGWTDNSAGTGTVYTSGDKFTIASSGNTLYAKWTNTYAGDEFTLVEDLSDLGDGSKIVIIGTDAGGTNFYALKTTQQTAYRDRVASGTSEFTMSNSNKTCTLGASTSVQVITLEDLATPVSNRYQFNVENGYLYASSSSANEVKTQTTNNANGHWQIGLDAGVFTITAQGTYTHNVLSHNNSATRFACYTANQQPTYIYVKDEGTKYAITWANGGHGTAPTSPTNASKVTLPDISVTGYTNTGWKANQNVTNASTSSATITAGTLITNGTRVILGAATTFTAQWETDTYTITTSGLTNISPTSAFPANVAYTGSTDHSLDRTLQAADGYVLPATITVTMGGSTLTAGTDYTYSSSTGAFAISKVITDNIVISGSAYLRLDGIAVTTNPTKLAYFAGESFSNAGAVVTATMGDGTTKTVAAAWTPPATPLVAGASQTVSISYTENGMTKTTSVTINVYSVTVNKVNENGEAVEVSGVTAGWTVATKGLSASASSASKYVFKEWAFSGSNQELAIASTSATSTTVSGTPTGDVVINAVFWAPRRVVWMVNEEAYTKGSPTSTIAYNSSWSDLSLPTDPTIPCGDKFMGWTTTEIGSNGLDKDDDAAAIGALDLMTSDNKSGKTANKITAATTTFHAVLADYVEPAD